LLEAAVCICMILIGAGKDIIPTFDHLQS